MSATAPPPGQVLFSPHHGKTLSRLPKRVS